MTETRLTAIETQLAHQESLLHDLSDMIAQQWDKLDTMVRKLERIEDRVRALEGEVHATQPNEPPPPHY